MAGPDIYTLLAPPVSFTPPFEHTPLHASLSPPSDHNSLVWVLASPINTISYNCVPSTVVLFCLLPFPTKRTFAVRTRSPVLSPQTHNVIDLALPPSPLLFLTCTRVPAPQTHNIGAYIRRGQDSLPPSVRPFSWTAC